MLSNKEIKLLNELINGKSYSYKEISQKYNISDRAARYYIDNLDYLLRLLGYKITQKEKNIITLNKNQNFEKIYEILGKNQKLSIEDRVYILKLILFFNDKGLNITEFVKDYEVSRTTIKKDLKSLKNEFLEYDIDLVYENNSGYKFVGNNQKILLKQEELIEKILETLKDEKNFLIFNKKLLSKFYEYIKIENIEKIKEFILKIENLMKLTINKESYNKIIAYILTLLKFKENNETEEELLSKSFLTKTEEYKIIKQTLSEIFSEVAISEKIFIRITDLIMGMRIAGLEDKSLENWIDEDLMIRKMIVKISKLIDKDLTRDEILYEGLIYHIKPAMYRMKNNIRIENSVFKELILTKDPILKVVKDGIQELESLFNIEMPEDEIALIGFHIKAAIERNTFEKTKKVILVCGLGYGSSKVLEQSLKEKYDLDIVDILTYSSIENTIPNYKNIDLILTTINLNFKFEIPVIKINPLLKEEDIFELEKYGIKANKNKVSLKKLINIINDNAQIKNKEQLILDLKKELSSSILNDLTNIGDSLKSFLTKKNIKIIDSVKNWKEAILISGNMLVENDITNKKYVKEMIEYVEKFGSYIVIEEGIAIPHAKISENIKKTGVSLLVVKEKVMFESGKSANIFLSFATKEKKDNEKILIDLFELITKYKFIEKISKIKNYEDLKNYFEELV